MRPVRRLRFARHDRQALVHNPAHGFAARHALAIYPAGAIYSFIPKNGCSTLRYSIAVANGCILGPDDIDWIHANNWTFSADLRTLLTARYAFAVLRCPYRRLASVFLDKVVGEEPQVRRLLPRQKPSLARRTRGKLRKLSGQPPLPPLRAFDPDRYTFRSFVASLRLPGGVMTDHHWAPQSAFLVYENYDDLFCLEAFGDAVAGLRRNIGLEV